MNPGIPLRVISVKSGRTRIHRARASEVLPVDGDTAVDLQPPGAPHTTEHRVITVGTLAFSHHHEIMKAILAITSIALGAAAFASSTSTTDDKPCCSSTPRAALASMTSDKTIVETAVENGNFTTLATLLTKAELVGALNGKGPFTVFAPTDAAFAKIPAKTVETLLKKENKGTLQDILTFHVVSGKMSIVGPRPPLPSEVATYDERAARRLLVKPGLTGLRP